MDPMLDFEEEMRFFDEIKTVKEELDFRLENSELGEKKYNKAVVELAYKLALNGFDDRALTMLESVKGDYFSNGLAVLEFQKDSVFFDKCCFLFDIFNFLNKIPLEALGNIKGVKE
jgi:hypothetical protein